MNIAEKTAWQVRELHLRGNTARAIADTESFIAATLNKDEPEKLTLVGEFMDILSNFDCDDEIFAAVKLIADNKDISDQFRFNSLLFQASVHMSKGDDLKIIAPLIDKAFAIDKDACNRSFTYGFYLLFIRHSLESLIVLKAALNTNPPDTHNKDYLLKFIIKQKLDERFPNEIMLFRKLANF
jgi:hypothetical protein